ncbi:hypothetical protein AB6D66_25940, partial [Vibrio pomeroyi]
KHAKRVGSISKFNYATKPFADSEGSHFDTDEDIFASSLKDSVINGDEITMSQKELFMWDIYMLIDWHINRLWIELEFRQHFKRHELQPKLIHDMKTEIDRINNHYEPLLKSSLLSFSMIGHRTCSTCSSIMTKHDEFTMICTSCGNKVEL